MTSALFSPISLRGLTLPNRIVVSPMCQYNSVDGSATDWHILQLGQFSLGGSGGLVMTEATNVSMAGRITPKCATLCNDDNERALKRVNGTEAPKETVRGQYRAGASAGGPVKGYVEELGSESNTETFVAIKAEIANWRWAGVPFYLRTGKRLATRVSEIVIEFKPIPHSIFAGESAGPIFPNQLVIRLQPDEGVKQFIMIKDPGPGGMRLRQIPLDMSFAQSFKGRSPDAYERLIMDVIRGNQTLFMRRDEVEAAWKWIDPIQNAWAAGQQEVQGYTAGTWGPSASIALIERDGRTWHESN